MHYAAMQASIFFPLPDAPTHSMALSPTLLALLITIFTVLIAVSTLVATFAGRQNELALSLSAEISRRKRTEADLRRSETYLAEGQRLSHAGSWALDVATGQFIHSSEEHHRLFGFDPREGYSGLERLGPARASGRTAKGLGIGSSATLLHGSVGLGFGAGWRRGRSSLARSATSRSLVGVAPPRGAAGGRSSRAVPDGRRLAPSTTSWDIRCAIQGQCRSPSSHPQAAGSGDQLVGI